MYNDFGDINYYYSILEGMRASLIPFRTSTEIMRLVIQSPQNPIYNTGLAHIMLSNLIFAERLTRTYKKPKFNVDECVINGKSYHVKEEVVKARKFCELRHFNKVGLKQTLPKLLIIAPMAGHHATLVRDTVKEMSLYADVYLTDWRDASDIPVGSGSFDLDDYIDYLIDFISVLGPNLHTLAICQPTVPLLAAISILSANDDPNVPSSMTLIGGPIDARKNPTEVDMLAIHKSIGWFSKMMTSTVPMNYPGHGRKVFPGFLQLMAFISLDVPRHINSHLDLLLNLLEGNTKEADHTIDFYDNYLASMDMPAEFYLQTIQEVFKEFAMAKDELVSRGRKIHLKNISECALLGIEGERDNIAATGQTKAALVLCSNIPASKKQYYLQQGVGHYGTFSGSKFREFIAPVIRDFMYKHDKSLHKISNGKKDSVLSSDKAEVKHKEHSVKHARKATANHVRKSVPAKSATKKSTTKKPLLVKSKKVTNNSKKGNILISDKAKVKHKEHSVKHARKAVASHVRKSVAAKSIIKKPLIKSKRTTKKTTKN